jgi:hypothetical protein
LCWQTHSLIIIIFFNGFYIYVGNVYGKLAIPPFWTAHLGTEFRGDFPQIE